MPPLSKRLVYMVDHDEVVSTLVKLWRKAGKDSGRRVEDNKVGGVPASTMRSWEWGVSPTLLTACRLARSMGYQLQVIPAPKANEVHNNPTET